KQEGDEMGHGKGGSNQEACGVRSSASATRAGHRHQRPVPVEHQVERRSELKKIAREAGTPSRFVRSNLLLCCR
ncbi:MAG: hypothetical protein K1Y01_01995, partial [Vicinamibacteria bacterium]|nr:hypothetical protein [Vicinamibacteria bacterium]